MAERNFANRTLYHGDNLDFLRGMNSGTVNLIATDPPFNKSKDFHATPDSLASGASFEDRWRWEKDVHEDWLAAIMRDEPEVWAVISTAKKVYGDDMGAFLCWLGVRLLEMHRVLADDGSLYLHIDHTAHAWAKCLLDAVFGKANFRNEIVWSYRTGGAGKTNFARKHDTLLWYSVGSAYTFHQQKEKAYTKAKGRQPGVVNYGGGEAEFFKDENGVYNWVNMRDVWEISYIGSTHEERTGYPTQKPLALYDRIINASSNPGDLVLDPFCGCATTPIAAERLGRQWVGMDIWDGAHQQVLDRLEKEKLAIKGRSSRAREKSAPPPLRYSRSAMSRIPRPPRSARTTASLRRWCCELRRARRSVTPRRAPSMGGYWTTSARSVRVAERTTHSTPACWRWIISIRETRAARMPTRT